MDDVIYCEVQRCCHFIRAATQRPTPAGIVWTCVCVYDVIQVYPMHHTQQHTRNGTLTVFHPCFIRAHKETTTVGVSCQYPVSHTTMVSFVQPT
eukprot:gnl/Chilomastix_caulleri/3501.p2 GENE.gnl/Chilomastix_caulleri/3501~~gnl/Chilomastix_caulleri/3501.p2  ORF type:complete len:94 (-),score=16.49 gnl/Chilomastix_caulleri/3501:231-512(-)